MSNYVIEPGSLFGGGSLADARVERWALAKIEEAVAVLDANNYPVTPWLVAAVLDANNYPVTPWLVAAVLLAWLLTPKGRDDEAVRRRYFAILLPVVERKLR